MWFDLLWILLEKWAFWDTFLEILLKKTIEWPSEYTHKILNFSWLWSLYYLQKLAFEISVGEDIF